MARKKRLVFVVCGLIAPAILTSVAIAQSADEQEELSLESLLEKIDRLTEDNERQAEEIDELRSKTGDNWLTEARAEEIRGLVSDVLADADVRASHLQNGLTAGWSENFFLASPDGRFKLQIDGQIQFRFIYNYHDQDDTNRWGFENTRTKLTFRGHVFSPNIKYFLRMDKTRNEQGLVEGLYFSRDAWIGYQFDNTWMARGGLFKLPFSREELVSSAYQLVIERSLINENTNLGRSEGVEVTYAGDTFKWQFMVSDGATDSIGGFLIAGNDNSANRGALTEDTEFAWTTRLEFLLAGDWEQFRDFTSPMGDEFGMLFGVGLHWEKEEFNGLPSGGRNEKRWFAGTMDYSIEWGGANAFVSATYNYVDALNFNANIWGWVVQGGFYFTPKWEAYGRWEYGWWDTSAASFEDLNVLTLGVNYYMEGQDLKWSLDIGYAFSDVSQAWDSDIAGWRVDGDDQDADPQFVLRTQFQLLF